MQPAIRTENLGKTYLSGFLRRPFVGLEGLTLEVPAGVSFGFVGPNGAGKTTTIKILMGLQRATAGNAWIFGVPIDRPESRRSVGFMPERPYFYEHLTAWEFMDFYARLSEVPAAGRSARIEGLLSRVGLERFRNVPLRKYSKGMLQRAGIAQALVADPELVVLDEPMSGLDPLGRVLVRDIILEERKRGKTVFFSSHILSDVESICDRVAIVVAGALRGQGTLPELIGNAATTSEITFRGAVEVPGAEVVRQDADSRTVRVPCAEVGAVCGAVLAGGGTLVEVHRNTRTLEDVLLDEVERARLVNEKRLGVLA
ncbi:ABC transporter ATP-binding protein [Deltaproteobacteria bacterium]|nr:ABC transporter ATP-binding protein [Deltaproteobacteria bacterium]